MQAVFWPWRTRVETQAGVTGQARIHPVLVSVSESDFCLADTDGVAPPKFGGRPHRFALQQNGCAFGGRMDVELAAAGVVADESAEFRGVCLQRLCLRVCITMRSGRERSRPRKVDRGWFAVRLETSGQGIV
jgi:hypothetical protein